MADDRTQNDDEQVDDAALEAEALAARGDIDGDGDVDAADDALLAAETGAASAAAASGSTAPARVPAGGAPTTGKGGPRFVQFLRACWQELQRVQWPDRRQVGQATAVVLGFVVVAGAYLGIADYLAKELVDFIL